MQHNILNPGDCLLLIDHLFNLLEDNTFFKSMYGFISPLFSDAYSSDSNKGLQLLLRLNCLKIVFNL